MMTTTATAIEQQSLSHYNFASSLTESSFEVSNDMEFELESIIVKHYNFASSFTESSFKVLIDMEFELESIMVNEFAQGLPCDLDSSCL